MVNKCINSKILPEFLIFLIFTFLCIIINFVLFSFEFKTLLNNTNIPKDCSYYIILSFLILYLFIFSFEIFIVASLICQRISAKISSKKKVTLEENLIKIKDNEEQIGNHNNVNN